jgi:hypothetical protein
LSSHSETAILLPIRIIGYASFENGVKRREQLAADSDQNVHFGLAFTDPTCKILSIARNHPDGEHG